MSTDNNLTIGFVGLGMMGFPMARNLLSAGFYVQGYTLLEQDQARFAEAGGTVKPDAASAASGADIIITMLPNGRIVREAVMGDKGIAEGMSPSALYIDMSTTHPMESDQLREDLAQRGLSMMDAPVGRTAAHAETGTLLVLAGGTQNQLARTAPVFAALGEEVLDCGGPGMGIRVKLINNFMSISLNALSCEALTLCDALGLSRELAIKVMQGTPAGKGHFTTTYPKKVFSGDVEPDFSLNLAHKDLGLALDVANLLHVPLSMGAAAREMYSIARGRGFGPKDWTALLISQEQFYIKSN
jgi:4-hydroxybutyrate dehydrogenase/sulfolactaldehyde 3-reductase